MVCPVCKSDATDVFLSRTKVPVHQNLICHDKESAIGLLKGDLSMAVCENCGFIYNKNFDPSLLQYGEDYDNTQTYSSVFKKHIDERINYLINDQTIEHCNIIEVGCGKGYFLRKLIEVSEDSTGIGFDPSYIGESDLINNRLRFEKKFYDANCNKIKADVVICRHVIEHVPDPINMLKSMNEALSQSSTARVYFETPCVEWILTNNVLWDFFYEHCSLFSISSLITAFQIAGFSVTNSYHVFGGQYIWLEAKPQKVQKIVFNPGNIVDKAINYSKNEAKTKEEWCDKLNNLNAEGRIAVWGAGAKGVTFLNLVDPDGKKIDCVVDINPNKQGKYIPGTGHEIISPDHIIDKKIKNIILMNPNYLAENMKIAKDKGLLINWW